MFSRPALGTEKDHTGLRGKIVLGLSVVLTAICLIFMLFYRNEQSSALNGELLGASGSTALLNDENSSFLGKVFEYFGGVTYLFPLLIVYGAYKLFYKRFSWKEIDFFVIGTFVVGFNFLVIGLCSLFSVLFVAGETGAGGMLGDFLTIALFNKLPSYAAMAVPLVLTLCGLFLFTHRSPMWYCDAIGSLICGSIPFIDKGNDNHENVEKEKQTEENLEDEISISTIPSEIKDDRKPQTPLNPVMHDKEPVFGNDFAEGEPKERSSVNLASKFTAMDDDPPRIYNGPDNNFNRKANNPKPQQKIEPLFGANVGNNQESFNQGYAKNNNENMFARDNLSYGDNVSSANYGSDNKGYSPNNSQGVFADNNSNDTSSFADTSAYRQNNTSNTYYNNRYDNNASLGSNVTTPNSNSYSNNQNVSKDPYLYSQEKMGTPVYNKSSTPTTIIRRNTGNIFNAKSPNRVENNKAPTTIINSNRIEPKFESPNNNSALNEANNSQTTIINYNRQESFIKQDRSVETQKVLASEEKIDGVTTLINRAPEVKPVNFTAPEVSMYEKEDNTLGGSFTHNDENQNFNESAYIPQYEEENENIISFNEASDFNDKDEDPNAFEINNLSNAFIPSDTEDPHVLVRDNSDLISEKDLNYDANNLGTRGVLPQEQTLVSNSVKENEVVDVEPYEERETQNERLNNLITQENVKAHDVQDASFVKSYAPNEESTKMQGLTSIKESLGNLTQKPEENPLTVFPTKNYACSIQTVPTHEYGDWRPPFSLLKLSDNKVQMDEDAVKGIIERIDKFMVDFKIKARVERYLSGPVITQYDLRLAPGVKSSTIRGVQMDLTRNLLVKSVRILDVVPGTPYVGLELPNPKRQLITLGDVVTQDAFVHTKASLPICLGVNAVGKPVVADLTQAPHLLICGTTGSGKSAGVNSMILSLLLTCSPSELRLILIDPKQVEFCLYSGLPHLITPIIIETEPALAALDWLVGEMERRYTLIRNMSVHTIDECNALIRQAESQGEVVYDPSWSADMGGTPPILKPLPKIVLIIDEFADLMATSAGNKKGSRNMETLLRRITAKARAAGIHLIMATQTPRSDVVTGVIKSNIPSRIAYTVQSSLDSRVILDETGAENLLGNGDMLVNFQKLEGSKTFRAHGPFACNDDVKKIVAAWVDYAGEPEYIEGVTDYDDESEEETRGEDIPGQTPGTDKIFDQVAQYAREYYATKQKSPPISDIQVNFNVGYARAKRLKMQLIREGVVED